MAWNLDKNRPICPQLEEQICVMIANGKLCYGDKLFSVREVAVDAGVNPNTVQKAFEGLEQSGLIYSVRGSGWYVGDSKTEAEGIVKFLIKNKTEEYFSEMKRLGLDPENVKEYIKEWCYGTDTELL